MVLKLPRAASSNRTSGAADRQNPFDLSKADKQLAAPRTSQTFRGGFRGTPFRSPLQGGLKGLGRAGRDEGLKAEGGSTFGRLQGASRGLEGGFTLKGAYRGLERSLKPSWLEGSFKEASLKCCWLLLVSTCVKYVPQCSSLNTGYITGLDMCKVCTTTYIP